MIDRPLLASLLFFVASLFCAGTAQAQSAYDWFVPRDAAGNSACPNGNCSLRSNYYAPAYSSPCPNGNCRVGTCANGRCTTGNCANGVCNTGNRIPVSSSISPTSPVYYRVPATAPRNGGTEFYTSQTSRTFDSSRSPFYP